MLVVMFVLIILVSILLMIVVLVQNSKGGGLSADFTSSNQVMGVRKTADFLEKATWTLAISLLVLCLLTSAVQGTDGTVEQTSSELQEDIEALNLPQGMPIEQPAGQ